MNRLSDSSFAEVLSTAEKLFLEGNIRTITIKDIAKASGVGEATIYRHFKTKQNIILQVALNLAEGVHDEYFQFSNGETGFECLRDFYYAYLNIFREKRSYYSFIQEFDAYILSDVGDSPEYEGKIDVFHKDFVSAYNKGVNDGTVKEVESPDLFYFSTAHALLNLCKSLSVKKVLVPQDALLSEDKEIEELIKIILNCVKKV